MSGIVGHTMYAILGGKAASQRKLPIAPLIHRHWASYLCGSYLGCDIQTLPEAVCTDTGKEVGYGTVPVERSPLTGGAVRPWTLRCGGKQYTARDIHTLFYGRSHVVFGWSGEQRKQVIPWDHLADYCALVAGDAIDRFGPGERPLAYVFGWMTHVVGDSLIKSVRPGITLNLLNGKYTPENRPIQDLATFHEVGRKELQLNWHALFADLADTPVEPVQLHYMRVAQPQGKLARDFPNGWEPEREELLRIVLAENRRYLRSLIAVWLKELELRQGPAGPECHPALSKQAGGLTYTQMIELADRARFRNALWQMAEAIADLFEAVVRRQPALRKLPASDGPTWSELGGRWRHGEK